MSCVQYDILADMFSIHQHNGETTIEDADFVDLLKAFYGPTPLAFAIGAKFMHPIFMRPFNVLRFSAPNRCASAMPMPLPTA